MLLNQYDWQLVFSSHTSYQQLTRFDCNFFRKVNHFKNCKNMLYLLLHLARMPILPYCFTYYLFAHTHKLRHFHQLLGFQARWWEAESTLHQHFRHCYRCLLTYLNPHLVILPYWVNIFSYHFLILLPLTVCTQAVLIEFNEHYYHYHLSTSLRCISRHLGIPHLANEHWRSDPCEVELFHPPYLDESAILHDRILVQLYQFITTRFYSFAPPSFFELHKAYSLE